MAHWEPPDPSEKRHGRIIRGPDVTIPIEVLRSDKLTPAAKCVYGALRYNGDEWQWRDRPALLVALADWSRLAEDAGVTTRTVKNALEQLVGANLILRLKPKPASNSALEVSKDHAVIVKVDDYPFRFRYSNAITDADSGRRVKGNATDMYVLPAGGGKIFRSL